MDQGSASDRLDVEIRDVLRRDTCAGCGLCALLDPGIAMKLNQKGYLRPVRTGHAQVVPDAVTTFRQACPGVTVRAGRDAGLVQSRRHRHPTMGSYLGMWQAFATDQEIRHHGSSGGVLTALHAWLLESGRAARIGSAAPAGDPRRSLPITISTPGDALRSAGSRYTPVATLANPDIRAGCDVVTGKPCEVAALRAADASPEPPLILSFFCAGTPSATATDRLANALGLPDGVVPDELWYRGRGWPGRFTVKAGELEVSADYETSWGGTLGPATQWRCRMCADGVGESADIVAADYWAVDLDGYPLFKDGPGVSALIARTQRGLEVVLSAQREGVLVLEDITGESLAAVQPLQDSRRRSLSARLLGSRLAGYRGPKYRGFGLVRLGLRRPRQFLSVTRATYRKARAAHRHVL